MQSGSFEVGDMVKFERGAYDHWGVYIGGGEIVHIGPEGTDEELNSLKLAFQGETKAAFKRDPLKRIAGNSCYYAHNYLDHKHTPYPKEDIKHFALSHLKGVLTWNYNIIMKNCENFAIWCRYRVDYMGDQARNGVIVGAVGVGLAALGLAALAGYSASKKEEEEKKKEKKIEYRY
ncbi:phospholipase A and acyltransferase 3-like [Symsagittifera roscoffensis]|uniref:phospholipase A and acyltransferase 3-like n=1 Tax=Symsagittifera roscoffensis TaxID=84072 RepID=UPI00307BAD8B